MRKPVTLAVLLFLAACSKPATVPSTEPSSQPPSALPEASAAPPAATFDLEGIVIEASGSAVINPPSPKPKSSSKAAPAVTQTAAPAESPEARRESVKGAPGSIALKLTAFTTTATSCNFRVGDVLVFSYSSATQFDPPSSVDENNFPDSLKKRKVSAKGTVRGIKVDDCLLLADSVHVESAPTPAPSVKASATPKPSTTPKKTPAPAGSPHP